MRNLSYNKFWQKIHLQAKKEGFPLRVMFEITYSCNFFCKHCYVPLSYRKKYKEKELKTKEVFSILEQLKQMGCFYLGFTGGEPFLREDFLKILRYAKSCGMEIIIYTNGSLINEKIVAELIKIQPNKVDITLPAMSEEVFSRITGVKKAKDKVFKAIKLLLKNKINLGFKSCLLKENEREIPKIIKFCRQLKAFHRLDNQLCARLDGSKEPFKYRSDRFRRKDYSKILDNECQITNTNYSQYLSDNRKPITKDLFLCGAGRSQVAITPSGELKLCVLIDYPKYNILKLSFKKAWQKLKTLRESLKVNKDYQCDSCKLKSYCHWCPAVAWAYNRTFTSCTPESRIFAQINKGLI